VPVVPRALHAASPPNAWKPDPSSTGVDQQGCLNVDVLIETLRNSKRGTLVNMSEGSIKALIEVSHQIICGQPCLLELQAPLTVLGDIHGQFSDLLDIFDRTGHPPDINLLMLGDYVDRGKQSLETICLLLAYKVKYPENVFLLRGNHECAQITRIYGFYDECKRRHSVRLWKSFCGLFNTFPAAALVDDRIMCMHGGLSPELQSFDQIRHMSRPVDVPDTGLLCDLLWSDPDKDVSGWCENDRGVSYIYGSDVVSSFNSRFGLDLIVRGHQVVEDGYEFFAGRGLVTLFSAPNYVGEFDNAAGIMHISDDLQCSFTVVAPKKKLSSKGGRR